MPRKPAKSKSAPARRTKSGAKVARRSNAQQAQLRGKARTEPGTEPGEEAPKSKVKGRTWTEPRVRKPAAKPLPEPRPNEADIAFVEAEEEEVTASTRRPAGQRLPAVAIVGRPNVGKSALFNRLVGRRISIVHEQPGVTRDRITAICKAAGEPFELVDTGGIGAGADADFADMVQMQVDVAVTAAELILFAVDGRDGVTPVDAAVARTLRKSGRRVLLVVNKIDEPMHEDLAVEFEQLGFDESVSVSAAHGRGMTDLVDRVAALLALTEAIPAAAEAERRRQARRLQKYLALPTSATLTDGDSTETTGEGEAEPPLLIAIVGRPNVGKSSLINAILEDNRTLVSEVAGTTRDAVDIAYELDGKKFVLIDTAGIRPRTKMKDSVEVFSAMRSERSIRRADLCILVLDCSTGPTEQDQKIASLIKEAEKPCLVVCNKFDLLLEGSPGTTPADLRRHVHKVVAEELHFIDYAQPVTISALKRNRIPLLFQSIEIVREDSQARLGTGVLNRLIEEGTQRNPPPPGKGNRRLKILYGTQPEPRSAVPRALYPPEFILFVNDAELMLPTYQRFIENSIRANTPYRGLPILIRMRSRGKRKAV
jgi:GTP-binding protein